MQTIERRTAEGRARYGQFEPPPTLSSGDTLIVTANATLDED